MPPVPQVGDPGQAAHARNAASAAPHAGRHGRAVSCDLEIVRAVAVAQARQPARPLWWLQTSQGCIVVALWPEHAPLHLAALTQLIRAGFYNGTVFHRMVANFVVQGGDPTASGAGGPGFVLPAEPRVTGGAVGFDRGVVGVADSGKDTGGSQFFIMLAPAPHLDGRYTAIGEVIAGLQNVERLTIGDQIVVSEVVQRP